MASTPAKPDAKPGRSIYARWFSGTRNTPFMQSRFLTHIWTCVFSRNPAPG